MRPALLTERNGWKLYAHAAFGQRLEALLRTVEALEKQQPETYRNHPKAKLLKRTLDLILAEIPRDPNHWRRARFLGRFRLFLRFSSVHKVVVYAWVNDETTLRIFHQAPFNKTTHRTIGMPYFAKRKPPSPRTIQLSSAPSAASRSSRQHPLPQYPSELR